MKVAFSVYVREYELRSISLTKIPLINQYFADRHSN